jgi:Gamma-butyrobetaine hydroxylase-like, N-terminal
VTDVGLFGQYALQIGFESGHATGIYTFRYLRMLDPKGAASGSGPPGNFPNRGKTAWPRIARDRAQSGLAGAHVDGDPLAGPLPGTGRSATTGPGARVRV